MIRDLIKSLSSNQLVITLAGAFVTGVSPIVFKYWRSRQPANTRKELKTLLALNAAQARRMLLSKIHYLEKEVRTSRDRENRCVRSLAEAKADMRQILNQVAVLKAKMGLK